MAFKKLIKNNEARILIYLKNADVRLRYTRAISSKLDIVYGYAIHTLKCLAAKGWIREEKMPTKTYYHIAKKAPLEESIKLLEEIKKDKKREQQRL